MRSPGIVAVVGGLIALVLSVLAPSLIAWGNTVAWWIQIPVVGIALTIMLGASIVTGIAVQEWRVLQLGRKAPQNGKVAE